MKKIVLIIVSGITWGLFAQAGDCDTQVSANMHEHQLNDFSIYHIDTRTTQGDSITGYWYWIKIPECPTGYVQLNVSPMCTVSDVYTRLGCGVEGLRYFWP